MYTEEELYWVMDLFISIFSAFDYTSASNEGWGKLIYLLFHKQYILFSC